MNTKLIYTFLIALLVPISVFSQNLNRMKEEKRNQKLIGIATEAVKTYMPEYYREYGKPIITKDTIEEPDTKHPEFGERKGRIIHTVKFPYDDNKEYFRHGYAAIVQIWGDNGEVYSVMSGNHYAGRRFREHEAKTIKKVLFPYIKAEKPKSNVEFISPEEYERRKLERQRQKQQ